MLLPAPHPLARRARRLVICTDFFVHVSVCEFAKFAKIKTSRILSDLQYFLLKYEMMVIDLMNLSH